MSFSELHEAPPSAALQSTAMPVDALAVAHVEGVAMEESTQVGLSLAERALKRVFDLLSIVVILALFWWVIIGVAIAVRLTSSGPVIYGHKRVGRHGREFKCYKFRSMVSNSDQVLSHLLAHDAEARAEWERDFKLKNDPRITRVGKFIRKTSIDEFPQLWNVLANDMSIVGPRPVVLKELNQYYGTTRAHYESVKPGLTGLWQVSGRNDMEYEERVALDKSYVLSWGVFTDFMIVMRTVGVIFGRKGAY
jgi:exopolysaccharide production protein ExoY